jgi:AraC-like DNA-binding protein
MIVILDRGACRCIVKISRGSVAPVVAVTYNHAGNLRRLSFGYFIPERLCTHVIFRRRQASGPLSKFIEFFWFYKDLAVTHSREKLLPNAAVELIIDLSPTPKRLYTREDSTRFTSFRRAWISGMQRQYLVLGPEPGSSMMGVHFYTGGAAPFFEFPASELTASVIELDLIWKQEVHALRDQLLEEPDISCKFDLLESYLFAKARHRLEGDHLVDVALRALRNWPILPLPQLASQIGVTQRQLISRFDCRVGCTPKFTSRLLRFRRALLAIHQSNTQDWADMSQRFGYYDQPHFIHEFQEFAGMSPAEYVRRRTESPEYVYLD